MAYEMRISDWSSDVCSSDLQVTNFVAGNYRACNWNNLKVVGHADRSGSNAYNNTLSQARASNVADMLRPAVPGANVTVDFRGEIGSASGRERVVSTCGSRWSPGS